MSTSLFVQGHIPSPFLRATLNSCPFSFPSSSLQCLLGHPMSIQTYCTFSHFKHFTSIIFITPFLCYCMQQNLSKLSPILLILFSLKSPLIWFSLHYSSKTALFKVIDNLTLVTNIWCMN